MNYKQKIKNISILIIGNLLIAISIAFFILPFDIDNGGLSGISIILQNYIDPTILILILNWVLFFIGLIFLKKDFALKTLFSTIVYPFVLNVIYRLPNYNNLVSQLDDTLLAAVLGAIAMGIGLGMIYKVGGSSGGLDVVSLLLNKYLGIKISQATFVIDFLIIFIGLFTVSLNSCLYGIIMIIISAYLIEKTTIMGNSSYMMHIISSKYQEITDYIINDLSRGCTLIEARGGISLENKQVIEVIINEKEYFKIKQKIRTIDNEAFISVYKAVNVYGNGFEMLTKK